LPHPLISQFLAETQRLVHRGKNEILQHLRILGIDDFGRDRDGKDISLAVRRNAHHAPSGRTLHFFLRKTFLDLKHLGLHLLSLFEQFIHLHHTPHSFSERLTRSMMVPHSMTNGNSPIELFKKKNKAELMRERHGRKRDSFHCAALDSFPHTMCSADNEQQTPGNALKTLIKPY
jgi:hypothetical protein